MSNLLQAIHRAVNDPFLSKPEHFRGMWGIENPNKIFEYLNAYDSTADFQLMCLMRSEKFASFPPEDQAMLYQHSDININDVRINNPNNPAILLDAKLISYRS